MGAAVQERLEQGFVRTFGGPPGVVSRAPGRVNLIGEHTDYNDGFALPVAIGAETRVALRRRNDGLVRVIALDLGRTDEFAPAALSRSDATGDWRAYVRGVFAILTEAGAALPGCEVAIAGDIPRGTGLSSSASLAVAIVTAIVAMTGQTSTSEQVARWAQAAETDYVGVRCGVLDQLAVTAAVPGSALLIDCRSLSSRAVPLAADLRVVIVQSGVARNLSAGDYNLRRRECEAAAAGLGVSALRDADLPMLERGRGKLSDVSYRRARHVITENSRTLEMADALRDGDLARVGRLMAESHASQRFDFEITVQQTDQLVDIVRGTLGDQGGVRQTGGGFGGAVVALTSTALVDQVRGEVLRCYRTPEAREPDIRIEEPHGGAAIIRTQA